MRGMMVTVLGEDYLTLAEANYAIGAFFSPTPCATPCCPKFTGLAISLGYVVAGATIVELIFPIPTWVIAYSKPSTRMISL